MSQQDIKYNIITYINYYYLMLAAVKRRCPEGFTPVLKHLRNSTRQSHLNEKDYLIYFWWFIMLLHPQRVLQSVVHQNIA